MSHQERETILPPNHPQQTARLAALNDYGVLDTEADIEFDEIVELASRICDVPVSLISLVDEDRQWFKAKLGFDPSETDLQRSICAHAILEDGYLEIENLAEDARTSDNPLHTDDPNVQFYAGANLVSSGGLPVGTLCVLDTKPRKLTEFQTKALKTLAHQVITRLELRKKLRDEKALRAEIDHRVKNSLQTITSLLRIATRQVDDPVAVDVLEVVQRRIGSVASLHSELMKSDKNTNVNSVSYVDRLGKLLREMLPVGISLTAHSSDMVLNALQASAIGMIVSEFTANSVKHAFPGNRGGEISITLAMKDAATGILTCKDNGVGNSAEPEDSEENTGLGAQLMASAAIQLNGAMDHRTDDTGTTTIVEFPVN